MGQVPVCVLKNGENVRWEIYSVILLILGGHNLHGSCAVNPPPPKKKKKMKINDCENSIQRNQHFQVQ